MIFEEGLRKTHSLFFFWRKEINMDILIHFLTTVAGSFVGIILASWVVDRFHNWQSRRRH